MGQFTASFIRPDVKAAGIGDGQYGFKAHIPDTWTADATLDRFAVFTSGPERVQLVHSGQSRISATAVFTSKRQQGLDAFREMFEPLLRRHASVDRTVQNAAYQSPEPGGSHRLIERLLGPSPIKAPAPLHGHSLSAYVDHIRYKYEMQDVYDTSFAISEFDGYLKWYLENYAAAKGAKRAPLSAEDLAYLNSPVAFDATARKISRVALLFVRDYIDSLKERRLTDFEYDLLVYRWAVEESRKLFVEDRLVTEEQKQHLQTIADNSENIEYPLSIFMKIFVSRNVLFRRLSFDQINDRKLIYVVLVLYAMRIPHILDFMPQRWLGQILETSPARSLFEEFIVTIFGQAVARGAKTHVLRIGQRKFEWHPSDMTSPDCSGHRVFAARLPNPSGPLAAIQIIGPFRRTLGLAHSCRRLAELIDRLSYKLNLFDFDLENASQTDALVDVQLDRLVPARINILHLNPETLPAAIAYLPDVFSDAYNIGFCYWELRTPAECQLLGLALPDEIWVASNYLVDAFKPFCKSIANVGMTYEAIAPPDRRKARTFISKYGVAETDFVFLQVSDALSWAQRKNPMGAIRAFVSAFSNETNLRLIIKTHNIDHVSSPDQQRIWSAIAEIAAADTRIVLINETLSRDQHRNLIAAADCMVSLHRAEGFGLDLLEAMRYGVPLMATGYSGNLDFCDHTSTWLIDYDEVFLSERDYAFAKPGDSWADPHSHAAVATMREIYFNERKRRQMAENGRRFVEDHFSPQAISRRVDARLQAILSTLSSVRPL